MKTSGLLALLPRREVPGVYVRGRDAAPVFGCGTVFAARTRQWKQPSATFSRLSTEPASGLHLWVELHLLSSCRLIEYFLCVYTVS